MMLTIAAIEASMPWTPPVEVPTKTRGLRQLRRNRGEIPESFWELWRTHKVQMAALGVSPVLKDSVWSVTWWQEVAPAVLTQRVTNLDLSRATDLDVDLPVPVGLDYLPFQKAGIVFCQDKEGALIGDEMGLGKTIQGIGVINVLPKLLDILIVCPSKLKLNWLRELRKWLVRDMEIAIAEGDCFPTTPVVIINYDIVHRHQRRLEGRLWDLILLDEVHYLKNPKARRTRVILGFKPTREEKKNGVLPSSGLPCRKKLAMTGTPILNKPLELYPVISWLDRKTWNDEMAYARRYCRAERKCIGKDKDGNLKYCWDTRGASNLEELQVKLRETILIRRFKRDVLKDLPPKRRQVVVLPSDSVGTLLRQEGLALDPYEERLVRLKANTELAKADDDDRAYRAAVDALQQGVKVPFDMISRIRHQTAMAKLPLVKEHIENALEELDKAIVFAYHRDIIDALHKSFEGVGCLRIYGGMSNLATQAAVDSFQNDPFYKLMILSIPVATGMTLTAASHGFFVELDWVPGIMNQAEDRMHRYGQEYPVNIYHLVLEGSLDCSMVETLIDKQEMIDRALGKPLAEAEAAEPLVPTRHRHVNLTREELATRAQALDPTQVQAVHAGLKRLAPALRGVDALIARTLAGTLWITPKQAVLGARILKTHQAKLPTDLAAVALR